MQGQKIDRKGDSVLKFVINIIKKKKKGQPQIFIKDLNITKAWGQGNHPEIIVVWSSRNLGYAF